MPDSELLERDISDLRADVRTLTDKVKNFGEDMLAKHQAGGGITAELKANTDKALTEMNEFGERLAEMEKKAARRPGGEASAVALTIAGALAQTEAFEAWREANAGKGSRLGRATFDLPKGAVIHGNTAAAGGALRHIDYVGTGPVTQPQRTLRVRDLLMPGRTAGQIIQYERETGFTNNAAPVSETVTKPESTITFEAVTETVKTIAHWIRVSKNLLADVPQLQSHIDGRLTYGLKLKEETQFLNGSGAGNNIEGLVTAATSYSAPIALTGDTMIDTVRLAILQALVAEYAADGIVLNPKDWARIETLKDDQGRYIIGNPQDGSAPRLWRLPVVESNSQTEDKFLVGAFGMNAQIFDREDVSVQISDEDGDNFKQNMITVLVEERTALAIYRPEGFIYGDFGNV